MTTTPDVASAADLVAVQAIATTWTPGATADYRVAFAPSSAGRPVRAVAVEWCTAADCDALPRGATMLRARPASAGWTVRAATASRLVLEPATSLLAAPRVAVRLRDVTSPETRGTAALRITTYEDTDARRPIDTGAARLSFGRPDLVVDADQGNDGNRGHGGAPLRTLAAALRRATGGETIDVRSSTAPQAETWDSGTRSATVAVRGVGLRPPVIGGLVLERVGRLHVSGVAIEVPDGRDYGLRVAGAGIANVVFTGVDLTAGGRTGGTCAGIGVGARHIHLRQAWIHDCTFGVRSLVSAAAMARPAHDVTIAQTLIERVGEDGLQIAFWRGATVQANVIRDARRRGAHNDGIQTLGATQRLRIDRNRISEINDQGVLLGAAALTLTAEGPTNPGPNVDVQITNNLLYDVGLEGGGFALNVFGSQAVVVRHNTAWGNVNGGLLIGHGAGSGTEVAVSANLLDGEAIMRGAVVVEQRGNVLAWALRHPSDAADDLVCAVPDCGLAFADLRRRDLRPLRTSAVDMEVAGDDGSADLDGVRRPAAATVGAYEAVADG